MSDENAVEEREKFSTNYKTLLLCGSCTFDHEEGEDATYFFLSDNKTGDNEPCSINLADSRRFVVRLLTSLWTANDEFAGEVLEKCFEVDEDGRFFWPQSE